MQNLNRFSVIGKYYGFPQCCINEFSSGKSMGKDRVFKGTGFIPCEICNASLEKDYILKKIAQNRIHPLPFPEDNMDTFNENVFRMLISDKFTDNEKSFIKHEWFDIFDEMNSINASILDLLFTVEKECLLEHKLIVSEYTPLGKLKLSSKYKLDAYGFGKMAAHSLIEQMLDIENQPFGFEWSQTSHVGDYAFYHYEPFNGKEPKNILELEKIAVEAAVVEWNIIINKRKKHPLREMNEDEFISQLLKSVKDNYYLISFKAETKKDKTFGSDFDKHIDVFLDCNQHSDRVEKAIMYTQLILNKKYGNEMTGEIMKQKKNDIREYFVKWI